MFRSTTINRELVLSLAKDRYLWKEGGISETVCYIINQ
jgi:hypothetical protein